MISKCILFTEVAKEIKNCVPENTGKNEKKEGRILDSTIMLKRTMNPEKNVTPIACDVSPTNNTSSPRINM